MNKIHYGDLEITEKNQDKYKGVHKITGNVYVYGEAKFPKHLKKLDEHAKNICEFNLNLSLWLKGMVLIDGILSWALGEKTIKGTTILKVKIVGKLKHSYIAQKGDKFSHGETVKKAIEDLIYKSNDRDASEFSNWKNNLDKKITLEDAISGYRAITGACALGVKQFVESTKLPKKLTPRIVLMITDGKYGNDKLRKFFKNKR